MNRAQQAEGEIYRMIVLGKGGMEVLLVPEARGFCLPEVTISARQRLAENLTSAMKSEWGEDVVCLFQPNLAAFVRSESPVCYHTAQHWRRCAKAKVPTQWTPSEDLGRISFAEPCDYAAVQRSLIECDGSSRNFRAGSFDHLGWFNELYRWIQEEIRPKGFCLTGHFRQLNASASFSLIRFETDGPAVWFKAVGEPNKREFPITVALARSFPKYVPQVIAARSQCNGWLMQEVEGTSLAETGLVSSWEKAVTALAQLQIESIKSHDELLDCGAQDLKSRTLLKLVSPFMEFAAQLMEEQTKVPPMALTKVEIRLLEESIRESLSALGDFGIPDTLGHLDLNPGNIIVSPGRCAFLDWAEVYVGHPFFSLQYLLEHFRRTSGMESCSEERLAASYLALWEQVASRNCIVDGIALTPLLAVFAYAVGTGAWGRAERLSDPRTAGYLRSLVRRMKREANALSGRSSPCLS